MKSFTKRLIFNFTAVITLCFLLIYFLFNMLVEEYILIQAESALEQDIFDIMNISYRVPIGRVFTFGNSDLTVYFHQMQQPERLHTSIIRSHIIMINNQNQILMPSLETLSQSQQLSIEFLATYYINNQTSFLNNQMVLVETPDSSYYVKAATYLIGGSPVSILSYTDISGALAFAANMNQILLLLLVFSGLLSVFIALVMSYRFRDAIWRLCNYANVIGQGEFNHKLEKFSYKEFEQLYSSMNNMATTLLLYENNQKQFFQNVSHELRTPLTSIQGYAEAISQDILEKKDAADIILLESKKMADLVSALIYISRTDGGLNVNKISSINVRHLLLENIERMKLAATSKGKELRFIDQSKNDIIINSDEEKIETIVINILSNAIRHANKIIEIGYCADDNYLIISIKDDGKGVSDMDLPHIFERFYKGDSGNIGLGLAICHDLAKLLEGRIEHVNDNGTVFNIYIKDYKNI